MKTFKELNLQDLHWAERNSWKSTHELLDGDDEVIATMKRTSWWRSSYEVDAPGHRWVFERKGLWNRRIEITSAGTGDLFATFEYNWNSGGTLTMPDGRIFTWKRTDFWGNQWAWFEGENEAEPVLAFSAGGFFRARAKLTFDEDTGAPVLLVFLGWLLHTLMRQDQAATVAVVS